MPKIANLLQERAKRYDAFKLLADKDVLTAEETTEYESTRGEIIQIDDQIKRAREDQELALVTAQPVEGQEIHQRQAGGGDGGAHWRVPAAAENDPYANDNAALRLAKTRGTFEGSAKSLVVGGMVKMCALAGGDIFRARQIAGELYGESHPVTRALITSSGAAGGFMVPPDYMAEIIEVLRPLAVVRAAGPRTIPMPRGTMRLPGQASAATASYTAEDTRIPTSQQTLRSIVAAYKKLTAMVPVSNDMMRYADPAVDAFVRDDLVKVMALREDRAFLMDMGTQDTPRGMLSFANSWALSQGGVSGTWNTSANSVFGANGVPGDPLTGQNGGNFITSTAAYTLATAAAELGGAVNKLDQANVPDSKRVWFWNARTKNYLFNVQNSLGVYVYRDEMKDGTLLGYPFKNTNQIPVNIWDTTGTNKDTSLIFLTEMTEDMILDSMQLELAVSREGSYVDGNGVTVSAFQNDETLIRAIEEHDHQMRHDSAVAVIQGVRYAPAIS